MQPITAPTNTTMKTEYKPGLRSCTQCQGSFEVTDDDLALLEKISPIINGKKYAFPSPTRCFHCRLQRKLAFYNSKVLYRDTCDLTQKPIVSIYSPSKPFTKYNTRDWFSDAWDPMEFGQEIDFHRPFLEQLNELMHKVPLPARSIVGENVNSDFTNDNWKLKNCYLVFDCEQGENMYYGMTFARCKDCMDFVYLMDSELCFECVHCYKCYNLRYSRFCHNCSDSWFLRDCIGCRNCFGCVNLRQKQYCIFNEQKTEQEYKEFMKEFQSSKHSTVMQMRDKAEEFFLSQPVKAVRGEQNIESTGDNLNQSKDSHWCFDSSNLQDCRYCTDCIMEGTKDCSDMHVWALNAELCYNCLVVGSTLRNIYCSYYVAEGCSDLYYSLHCSRKSSHLFGCIGLRHKEYCILNKQYSKEEYEQLVPKIIEHMKKNGEWGEFFPPEHSAFGYNETMAQTYFPLSKEEVEEKGWQWCEDEIAVEAQKTIPASKLPDDSATIPDDVLNWAITCEVTGKPFKIIKQELEFYRTHMLPLPRRHPDQRHTDRYAYKNPFKLWTRNCAKCTKEIQTSYSPERKEIVYCAECYLGEVY